MSYRKDLENNEVYDTDVKTSLKIIYLKRYAKNKNGKQFYPKDNNGNEYMDQSLGPIRRYGRYILPYNTLGKPVYEMDGLDQKYTQKDGKYIIGLGLDGHEYYAIKHNMDEFYPPDNTPAKKNDGSVYYAQTGTGSTVFPKEGQNEYYLTEIDYKNKFSIPDRYAMDGEFNEMYPKRITFDNLKSETILLERYALDKDGQPFYPKDAFNNEFYLPDRNNSNLLRTVNDVTIAKRYAVTNDLKVILPSINNKYAKHPNLSLNITENQILGRLIRESYSTSGFLTSVVDATISISTDPKGYLYKDKSNLIQSVYPPGAPKNIFIKALQSKPVPLFEKLSLWIVIVISIVIEIFIIWSCFFKKETFAKDQSIK